MDKQYRVLNLNIKKEDNTGLETLIAELSEIQIKNILGLSFTPYMFDEAAGETFIIHPDSKLGKYLMNEPEEPKTLNLSEFKKGTINLWEGPKDVFYHDEFIRRKSEFLSIDNNLDFSYHMNELKEILADYYYKNKLTDNANYKVDIIGSIAKYREEIAKEPQKKHIAWDYFNLAAFLTTARDFEGAKLYFLKSATQEIAPKADAFFALDCLKTKLGENGDMELQKAIQLYEKDNNEYSEYAKKILSCSSNFEKGDTFKLVGKKRNGQVTAKPEDGGYSPAQINISFAAINNFLIRELRYADLTTRPNGYFEIEVTFLRGEASSKYISMCEISGFDFIELRQIIKKIYDLIPPNLK